MRRFLRSVFLLLVAIGFGACAGRNARTFPKLSELETCKPSECVHAALRMERWSDTEHFVGRLPYVTEAGNELHTRPRRQVYRVVVAFHGLYGSNGFNEVRAPPGLNQFRSIEAAFELARKDDPSLVRSRLAIVAPTFQRTDEWEPYAEKDRRYWHWPGTSWAFGQRASDREEDRKFRRADPVPGHDLIDDLLRQVTIKFPSVKQIVLVGHSGGGQAVHRYALLGTGVTERLERSGVAVRFVPANPGSYTFFVRTRLLPPGRTSMPGGEGAGENPGWRWTTPRGCEGYDDYRFGLSGLHEHPRATEAAEFAMQTYLPGLDKKAWRKAKRSKPGSATWNRYARQMLIHQYAERDVWHLQAASDTLASAVNCSWAVQGRSRLERFRHQARAWESVNPNPESRVQFQAVEGLQTSPHSSRAIYTSEIGRRALFY